MLSRYGATDRTGPKKRGQEAYPPPVRPPSAAIEATEDIGAGDLSNIYASGGMAFVRKASANDISKPANAFAPDGIANGDGGTLYFAGQIINGLSGLTPGTVYYLSVVGGGVTASPPSTPGNGVQQIGVALSATSLLFNPQPMVEFN